MAVSGHDVHDRGDGFQQIRPRVPQQSRALHIDVTRDGITHGAIQQSPQQAHPRHGAGDRQRIVVRDRGGYGGLLPDRVALTGEVRRHHRRTAG